MFSIRVKKKNIWFIYSFRPIELSSENIAYRENGSLYDTYLYTFFAMLTLP